MNEITIRSHFFLFLVFLLSSVSMMLFTVQVGFDETKAEYNKKG